MDLIKRCQSGDPNAFTEFFERYKNLVYRTALLMLDDREQAEDALQEIFLRVHRSLGSYQPQKGAVTTWLYRITVNYCHNIMRRRIFDLIPLDTLFGVTSSQKHLSMEAQIEQDEMHGVLQKLSPKLRAVIVLHYYWDLTYAEISQALEIPIGTVQSRVNQALNKIRKAMDVSFADGKVVSNTEAKSS